MQEAPTPQSKAEPGNGKIALGALLGLTILVFVDICLAPTVRFPLHLDH